MSSVRKRKSPYELTALILEHNPDASIEMIAGVISEWGGLLDDEIPSERRSTDMEYNAPTGQQRTGRKPSTSPSP